MRRLERIPVHGRNAMHEWPRLAGFWRSTARFAWLSLARYVPWLNVKNAMYRLVGMRVGRNAAIGLKVTVDVFFPRRISIGANSVVGYNTTILCHEFLVDEIRLGDVEIGRDVMIGANCTLLPGIRIGDGAVVAAHSLVNRDVAPGEWVGGVPIRPLRRGSAKPPGVP